MERCRKLRTSYCHPDEGASEEPEICPMASIEERCLKRVDWVPGELARRVGQVDVTVGMKYWRWESQWQKG